MSLQKLLLQRLQTYASYNIEINIEIINVNNRT